MTNDEKAKAYEMALEAARKELGVDRKEWEVVQRVLHNIFPELRESEDETIRKGLIDFVNHYRHNTDLTSEQAEWCKKALAYLEKQKEQKPMDNHLAVFLASVIARDIDRVMDGMCISNTELVALENAFLTGEYDKISDFLEKKYTANKQEQKPSSTEDMPYIADERFYEREPADSFKYKLAEYMTKCCTKKEGPYGYSYSISSESILEMAKEELIKRGVVQKPVEWSEGDTLMCNAVIELLRSHPNLMASHGINKSSVIRWLQSFRPQKQGFIDDICSKAGIAIPYLDGNQWCILKGDNIQAGVVGFGGTKEDALANFIKDVPIPQQWSEEDKKILDSLIRLYSREYSADAWPWANGAFTYGDVVNFLKSIRPQPEVKWSEEDEKRYVSIRTALEVSAILEKEEYDANVDWLRKFVNSVKYRKPLSQ